jgi:SAM-dependent methyltransferase
MNSRLSHSDLSTIDARNQSFWREELRRNILRYPSEHVVRFIARVVKEIEQPRTGLDIGFGSGQHLKLLMDFGFRANGVDFVAEAGELVQRLYGNHPLFGDIWSGDFRSIDLPKNQFDVVIWWGLAFIRPLTEIYIDLKLILELLRPGGRICINFRTKDNWFYGLGTQLEGDHFLLDERAGSYAGAHYTFVDEPTVRNLLSEAGFELENLERWDWWKSNLQERHSWWIVSGKRPSPS